MHDPIAAPNLLFQISLRKFGCGRKLDPGTAANEKIKAREFSYDAQTYLLMLGQLLHLFSLNELVDVWDSTGRKYG